MSRTGSGGGPWVDLERPKPPKVDDHYAYWLEPPPQLSERCQYWIRQIERGWCPNRRWSQEGYDSSAKLYGVWIWEYCNVISPALMSPTS